MFRLRTFATYLSAVAMIVCGGAAADEVAGPAIYQGTIQRVGNGNLTLAADAEETTFAVSEDTRILMNGIEASLKDLHAGQFAAITCEHQGDRLLAKMITAQYRRCSRPPGARPLPLRDVDRNVAEHFVVGRIGNPSIAEGNTNRNRAISNHH